MIKHPYSEVRAIKNIAMGWLDYLLKDICTFMVWINANFIGFTPNQITWLSLLMGILSGFFFFKNLLLWGTIFYLLRYLFDWADGKTARLTGKTSGYGAFIDNYTGIIASFFIIIGLTVGQYNATSDIQWLLISPIMLFLLQIHIIESSLFTIRMGSNLKKQLEELEKQETHKGFSTTLTTNTLTTKLLIFMKKHELLEPFNTTDIKHLLFFIIPLASLFLPLLKEMTLIVLALIIVKEMGWFFFYRKKLTEKDRTDNKR